MSPNLFRKGTRVSKSSVDRSSLLPVENWPESHHRNLHGVSINEQGFNLFLCNDRLYHELLTDWTQLASVGGWSCSHRQTPCVRCSFREIDSCFWGPRRGVPVSHVDFMKSQCPMSLDSPCSMSHQRPSNVTCRF